MKQHICSKVNICNSTYTLNLWMKFIQIEKFNFKNIVCRTSGNYNDVHILLLIVHTIRLCRHCTHGQDGRLGNSLAPDTPGCDRTSDGTGNYRGRCCNVKWRCTMCGLRLHEMIFMQEKNQKLKGELSKRASDENFVKGSDLNVKYNTGIPSLSLLMRLGIIPSLPKERWIFFKWSSWSSWTLCIRDMLFLSSMLHTSDWQSFQCAYKCTSCTPFGLLTKAALYTGNWGKHATLECRAVS